jgi:hypothetical protein
MATPSPLGSDISCTLRTVALPMPDGTTQTLTAVQPALDMHEVSGRTRLGEALVRRLTSNRGSLPDVVSPSTTANYGTNLAAYANGDLTVREQAQLGARCDAECIKDEEVVSSVTTVTPIAPPMGPLIVSISLVDGAGPFPLILSVSNVTTAILSAPR